MNDYHFHPFELAFSGLSNSGKTTLVSKLIKELSDEHTVGYLKHDAHHFDMDKEGKDTWQASQSGATIVSINDPMKICTLKNFSTKNCFTKGKFEECDFLLIEGYKKLDIPKLILIDDKAAIFDQVEESENVLGFIISSSENKTLIPSWAAGRPIFLRDEVLKLKKFILDYFLNNSKKIPTYGIILAGGMSSRMKTDKSSMIYHKDQTQLEYLYDILSKKTDQVFISCRNEQKNSYPYSKFPVIEDRFVGMGPLGGILSAMLTKRNAKWFVVACDLPLINEAVIDDILDNQGYFKMATAYENTEGRRLEPLCALYSPWAYSRMLKMLGIERYCPQKFLWNAPIKRVELKQSLLLSNANTPKDYEEITKIIGEQHDY